MSEVTKNSVNVLNANGEEEYSDDKSVRPAGALEYFLRYTSGQLDSQFIPKEDLSTLYTKFV